MTDHSPPPAPSLLRRLLSDPGLKLLARDFAASRRPGLEGAALGTLLMLVSLFAKGKIGAFVYEHGVLGSVLSVARLWLPLTGFAAMGMAWIILMAMRRFPIGRRMQIRHPKTTRLVACLAPRVTQTAAELICRAAAAAFAVAMIAALVKPDDTMDAAWATRTGLIFLIEGVIMIPGALRLVGRLTYDSIPLDPRCKTGAAYTLGGLASAVTKHAGEILRNILTRR